MKVWDGDTLYGMSGYLIEPTREAETWLPVVEVQNGPKSRLLVTPQAIDVLQKPEADQLGVKRDLPYLSPSQ